MWSNDTYCPEHGVGPVTVSNSGQSDPGVRVSPTTLTIDEGSSDPYQVVLLSEPIWDRADQRFGAVGGRHR